MVRRILLVMACHFLHMMSCGVGLSFGVLYREMRLEFGTSFTEAAWIASIYNGLIGFVGIPLGLIANRIGEKWPVVCGSLLLAGGMLTSMFATHIRTVYVTYGLTAGLGAGINHYCAYTVIPPHFDERWRPVALMLASAGVPMATLALPPILTVLIETFDWRKAYMFLAFLSLLGVPAGLIFYQAGTSKSENPDLDNSTSTEKKTALRFLKNPNFVLFLISTFLICLIIFVPSTFLPDLMHEFGRSSKDVYICLMTMGAGDVLARLLFGFIVQQIPHYVPFIRSAGTMLMCVSSCLLALSRSLVMYTIMSGLIGVGIGLCSGLTFYMAVHLLPAQDVRVGYGLALTLGGVALVAGMPLSGFVIDVSGTVRGAFIFTSIAICISSLLDVIIGIKEKLGKSSTERFEGYTGEVNVAYTCSDNDDKQSDNVKNDSPEQSSYI